MAPEDVLYFWFTEAGPEAWWKKSVAFDSLIRRKFGDVHRAADVGELSHWRKRIDGRLAEIIVLDQFSRNIYRDDARAFASDNLALALSQEAVTLNRHRNWSPERKSFLFMPFMHSESRAIHVEAVRLFSEPGLEDSLKFEHAHKAIIDRFGRYPHRNDILGRQSTPDETAFLQQPGSSF